MGILAKVSNECAKYNANIAEVSQTVLQDMFAMIMLVPGRIIPSSSSNCSV